MGIELIAPLENIPRNAVCDADCIFRDSFLEEELSGALKVCL
jgi:hypothetical protein